MRFFAAAGLSLAVLAGCSSETPAARVCDPVREAAPVPFADATSALRVDVTHHLATDFCKVEDTVGGPGVCMLDHDGDGDLDLYFADRAPFANRLLRNDGDAFADVTGESGAGDTGDSMGCLAFDADGDSDVDLYVTNEGPDTLYRNDGGVFTDVTLAAGIDEDGFSTSATAGDIDGDGDLDLYVARLVDATKCPDKCNIPPLACPAQRNLLYVNDGGGRFTEEALTRGLTEEEPTLAALFFDEDGDGDLDLYAGNDMGVAFPDRLYQNDGSGRFVDVGQKRGYDAWGTDTMGVDVGDYDADGLLEMVTSDFRDKPVRLYDCYDPARACSFEHPGTESLASVKWAIGFVDFDDDADLDLFWTAGDVVYREGDLNMLYWNRGGKLEPYVASSGEALSDRQLSRGAAFGDLDGDGDIDVAVANAGGTAQIMRNQASTGHWLTVALDTRSAGARVTVSAGGHTLTEQALVGGGYLGSSDPRLHFGLGADCEADVTVTWLGGHTRELTGVPADQVVFVDR